MADRELRRMHRAELIEIIYALKQSEDQLKAQNAALTAQLQDRQLRLEKAGSIAQAALELNNVFAAAQAAARTLDLDALAVLPDNALFSRLLTLDGVGKKVANCVCLFGYGRTAMAPIDVWIQRLIDEEFGGRDPFPAYGQQAGIVQQYLFYYKRSTSTQKK